MRRTAVVAVVAALLLAACDPTTGKPPPPGAAVPAYTSYIATVTSGDLGSSWRPGCPVGPGGLRRIGVSYWGYDGKRHTGNLIVAASEAADLVRVFRHLYDQRFQIRRIHPVTAYGSDDDRSMAANNTSAFNCRPVAGTNRWSQHSYGTAIDINPVQNPYVTSGGQVSPPSGKTWADRSLRVPGMIHWNGPVTNAFAFIGWTWGGTWSSAKDYQHLSANGR